METIVCIYDRCTAVNFIILGWNQLPQKKYLVKRAMKNTPTVWATLCTKLLARTLVVCQATTTTAFVTFNQSVGERGGWDPS